KGKARYEIFDTKMSAAALERLQLEIELRQAVKWGQLRLMYQPLVDLETEMVIGTEALVRWHHPDRGIISPVDFIPIAEESGMILSIGNWVLREACRQAREWQLQYPTPHPLKMSVNLSARQFQGVDLVGQVASILEETGLPAECLELEITESAVMEDAEATVKTLEELKKLGVKLAIDDFGTGYSSLAYIERFPLDVLKIDRSFVAQIGKNVKSGNVSDRSVVMQAVQTLGLGLGISITAEGIETPEQLAELRDMGCEIGQGFFWAKPLSSGDLGELLQEKNGVVMENR
ncbi:EAL domain-containing protein, partial [bacterium]